ncbi:MAG: hypothetical protein IKZ92_00415 [Muribaculaceae bacterium]|nr:hypothetical protein [Muribaculaceae bacterium]
MKKSLLFTIISIGAVFALAAREPQLRPTTGGSVSGLDNSGQLSFNDLTGCRIATVDLCDWTWNDADGTFSVEKVPFNSGWMTTFTPSANSGDGHVVIEGFYGDISLPVAVDYHASKVTLKAGVSLAIVVSFEQQGEIQIKREQNVYVVPEECLWSDDADLADINGMIDNDGSIMFDTGFSLYIEEVATSINRETQAVVSTDTIGALSLIFRNMCLRMPNGVHEFTREDQKVTLSEDAWKGIKDELFCASSVEEGSESVFPGWAKVTDLRPNGPKGTGGSGKPIKPIKPENGRERLTEDNSTSNNNTPFNKVIVDSLAHVHNLLVDSLRHVLGQVSMKNRFGPGPVGSSVGKPIKPGDGSGGGDFMGNNTSSHNTSFGRVIHLHDSLIHVESRVFRTIDLGPGTGTLGVGKPIKPVDGSGGEDIMGNDSSWENLHNHLSGNTSVRKPGQDSSGDNKYQVPVYMYQTEDGDLYVYNMYGMGCVRNYMNIHSDGTMTCPVQTIGYDDENGESLLNCSTDVETWNTLTLGNRGETTPDCIEWDVTIPCAQSGLLSTMFTGNKLYYTNGDQFVIPAAASNLWDLNNDGMVNISDVTDLIDHLLNGKKSDVNGNATDFSITDVTDLIDMLLQEK